MSLPFETAALAREKMMKTRGITALILAAWLGWGSQAHSQTILIDFGNASSWRGITTQNPDANGHYWNSVWSGAYYANLVDTNGSATTVDFGFSSAAGTDSYNGPAGVTSNPVTQAQIDATDIDAAALGNLGIKQATMDYYVNSSFVIQGLDPAKTYCLTFFGSHKYSDNDATVYSVFTNDTFSTVIASAPLNVQQPGSPWLHNRGTTVKMSGLAPQANNSLYVRFAGTNGGNGYLNCLRIEEETGLKVRNPEPGDGATGVGLTAKLKWNAPLNYSPTKYVLRFRANNANWLDTEHTTIVDPVVDLALDSDPATVEAAVPIALANSMVYYWNVSAFESGGSPIEHEGADWSFTTEAALHGPTKIIAHYMPWYQSQPVSGFWGWHWSMNHFSPPATIASHYHPLFGPYDSSDPHVLASQALLMKFAGIDGIIADWYGIEDFWDYAMIRDATNDFIPFVKEALLEFSICYEDQTVKHMLNNGHFANRDQAVAHGVEVMEWLEANYFADASYLKLGGRPVLLCFGPQFFTYSEWQTLFADLNRLPHFFTLPYSTAPNTGEFDWPAPGEGTSGVTSHLDSFYNRAESAGWDHYLAAAYPRFHDIYEQAGVGSSYGYIDDQDTAMFAQTLGRGLLSDADIVQVITWNDYGEGTIVEPTEEDGYTYLEILQQYRTAYIDANFSYTADDLRLPVRLYTLRKTYQANPAKMSQLDTAEDLLFADQLEQAQMLMNQVDCDAPPAGDFNSDCRVNLSDYERLSDLWLAGPEDPNWDPDYDISEPKDNSVNILDLLSFAENWLMITI